MLLGAEDSGVYGLGFKAWVLKGFQGFRFRVFRVSGLGFLGFQV